jgi:hypothetical protein
LFVLASCQNVLEAPTSGASGNAAAGNGFAVVRLGGGASRTIMPATPEFSRYELSFAPVPPTSGSAADIPLNATEADNLTGDGHQVELAAGQWTVTVRAYQSLTANGATEAREYQAAEGSETLTVTTRETAVVTVNITPIPQNTPDAPNGVFCYAITLPDEVMVATLTLNGGEAINLLETASGSWEIAPGVYDLLIMLENEDGLAAGGYELVYIYSGLESKAEFDLTGIIFADVVYLAGTVSGSIPAGVRPPYTVTAYSDEAHDNAIPGATVTGYDGTWFIKVPTSFIGETIYLTVEADSATGYQAFLGTETVSDILAKGKTRIALTVPVVNKTALNTAIGEADAAKSGVAIETAAANVPLGIKWVTQAEMNALTDAISAAEVVKNNTAATQTEVDSAVTTLGNAVTTFNNAKKTGTNADLIVADKTALNAAIVQAKDARNSVAISVDGTDKAPGTKWVTQDVLDTFNAAITAAETVVEQAAPT